MRVYAIWNGKGGTGKTTTAANLAYNLSVEGKKVLMMDLDPQVNLTPYFTKANENAFTVKDLFSELGISIKRCIYRSKYKGIDVIKGNTFLTEEDAECSDYILRESLNGLKGYDVVIIDCRPSFEALTRNALYAADIVVTPIQLDGYCKDNLALVQRVVDEVCREETKWVVFANRVRALKSYGMIYEDLITHYNYPLSSICINERAAVISASSAKKPLLKHRSRDSATQDFLSLSKMLMEE